MTNIKAKTLEQRVSAIERRNAKVELDKKWETSWARRISIALLTYVVVYFYMVFVLHVNPWLNALVPVVGFLLSTLALDAIRNKWESR